jgi:hypothetical protein
MKRALVLALAAACASKKSATVAPPVELRPGEVVLDDAGKTPRAQLRYRFSAGTHQSVTMKTSMSVEMGKGEQDLPAGQMAQEIDVVSVGDDGSARLEGHITDAKAPNGADSAILQGMKIHMTISADGKVSDVGAGATNALFDQVSSQLGNQIAIPLPSEAIGLGARWRYLAHAKLQGMSMDMATAYELQSIDGDHVVIAETLQPKLDGDALAARLAPGGKIDLAGSGDGRLEIDLTRPIPTTTMTMNLKFKVTSEGQTQAGKMKMTIDMHGT